MMNILWTQSWDSSYHFAGTIRLFGQPKNRRRLSFFLFYLFLLHLYVRFTILSFLHPPSSDVCIVSVLSFSSTLLYFVLSFCFITFVILKHY